MIRDRRDTMVTHSHPEIHSDIEELSKATTSEIGASEERLRASLSGQMDSLEGRLLAAINALKEA